MKQITKKYDLYNFDELSEEAKEKAIESFGNINVDYEWYDDDGYNEIAKDYGIEISMDGVSFDLGRGNFVAFDNISIEDEEKFCKKAGVNYQEEDYISIKLNHYGGNRCKNFIETYDYEEINKLQETLEELMEEILSSLKKGYEYLTSDDCIIETIKANEYTFLEDGTMFQ